MRKERPAVVNKNEEINWLRTECLYGRVQTSSDSQKRPILAKMTSVIPPKMMTSNKAKKQRMVCIITRLLLALSWTSLSNLPCLEQRVSTTCSSLRSTPERLVITRSGAPVKLVLGLPAPPVSFIRLLQMFRACWKATDLSARRGPSAPGRRRSVRTRLRRRDHRNKEKCW